MGYITSHPSGAKQENAPYGMACNMALLFIRRGRGWRDNYNCESEQISPSEWPANAEAPRLLFPVVI